MNRCILVTGVFLFLLSAGLFASDIDKYYAKKEYISPRRDTLRYRVLEPERIEKNKKYPLVLFLHGAGERGSDNEAQLVHGANMFLNPVIRDQHPTFVIYPQCPSECSIAVNQTARVSPAAKDSPKTRRLPFLWKL